MTKAKRQDSRTIELFNVKVSRQPVSLDKVDQSEFSIRNLGEAQGAAFTEDDFEQALRKVSRPNVKDKPTQDPS